MNEPADSSQNPAAGQACRMFVNEHSGPVRSVEFHEGGEGTLAFVHTKYKEEHAAVASLLQERQVPFSILGRNTLARGDSVLILQSKEPAHALLSALESTTPDQPFEEVEVEAGKRKKTDLMKWRGALGVTGQALALYSAFSKPKKETWNIAAAIGTLLSYAVNFAYGVQRKEDTTALHSTKEEIAEEIADVVADKDTLPDPSKNILALEETKKQGILGKLNKFFTRHATVISDAGIFASKQMLVLQGKSDKKTDAPDPGTWNYTTFQKGAGSLSQVGKLFTFAGKDEDPDTPVSEKSALDRFRERSNTTSGLFELASQASFFLSADARKKSGHGKVDYAKMGAAMFSSAAISSKIFAPFTFKSVNLPELYAYSADVLAQVPEAQRMEYTMRVAAEIKAMPHNATVLFGDIYTGITNALQQRHAIQGSTPALAAASLPERLPQGTSPRATHPSTTISGREVDPATLADTAEVAHHSHVVS